jgi:hypothetical protein
MGLVAETANAPAESSDKPSMNKPTSSTNKEDIKSRHDTALLKVLADALDVEIDAIQDFEL